MMHLHHSHPLFPPDNALNQVKHGRRTIPALKYAAQIPAITMTSPVDELSGLARTFLAVGIVWALIFVAAYRDSQGDQSFSGSRPGTAASGLKWPERFSKKIFDERRRRYIAAYPDARVALEMARDTQVEQR